MTPLGSLEYQPYLNTNIRIEVFRNFRFKISSMTFIFWNRDELKSDQKFGSCSHSHGYYYNGVKKIHNYISLSSLQIYFWANRGKISGAISSDSQSCNLLFLSQTNRWRHLWQNFESPGELPSKSFLTPALLKFFWEFAIPSESCLVRVVTLRATTWLILSFFVKPSYGWTWQASPTFDSFDWLTG